MSVDLEPHDGIADAARLWPLRFVEVLPAAAHAVYLLGQVDHLEPRRECPHEFLREGRAASRGPEGQFRRTGLVAAAPPDRRDTIVLDQTEEFVPALVAQHLADESTDGMHVVAQCHLARRKVDVLSVHARCGLNGHRARRARAASMVVAAGPVSMTVRQLLTSGFADAGDFDIEVQRLARHRMVAVECHGVTADLGHGQHAGALRPARGQLHADRRFDVELQCSLRDDLHETGVARPVAFLRGHDRRQPVARVAPGKRLLQSWHDVAVAMQVGDRRGSVRRLQNLARIVLQRVVNLDDAIALFRRASGSRCTGAGVGNLFDSGVEIAAGGQVVYTVHATIDPGATGTLVNEAYVKLVGGGEFVDRAHFLAASARAMRHILVNAVRRKLAERHGGGQAPESLEGRELAAEQAQYHEILDVAQALDELSAIDERLCRLVECRFYAGMTEEETATALGLSDRTVRRDWLRARAWLKEKLGRLPAPAGGAAP